MSFTLAEPDFELRIGDRIRVYDEEEQISVYGNVSKIEISGNLSMFVTCGGFDSAGSSTSFTPTSFSQIQQSKQEAKAEVSDNAVYTKKIAFKDGGFALTFSGSGGDTVNEFSVTENSSGNITKITNTTAGRSIDITYD